jgi:hypothetical protein
VAGDPAKRPCPRPRCRRITGHTKISPACTLRAANLSGEPGGVSPPRQGTAPTGGQLHSWTQCASHPSGVPRRWRRRCLTGRHRPRWSDDRRIPPARCPRAPQARETPSGAGHVPRRHPQRGGAIHEERPRPTILAPRDCLSTRTVDRNPRPGSTLPLHSALAAAAPTVFHDHLTRYRGDDYWSSSLMSGPAF